MKKLSANQLSYFRPTSSPGYLQPPLIGTRVDGLQFMTGTQLKINPHSSPLPYFIFLEDTEGFAGEIWAAVADIFRVDDILGFIINEPIKLVTLELS